MTISVTENTNTITVSTTINSLETQSSSSTTIVTENSNNIGIQTDNQPTIQILSEGLPLSHNYTHFINGTDPITPEDIGAQPSGNYSLVGHQHVIADIIDLTPANIGAQNAWEVPLFISNSFNAVSGKHYIIKSQIGTSPTIFTINDPSSASIGDFYIVYFESNNKFINIGGVTYITGGTLLVRAYESVGLSGQWKTRVLTQPSALASAWINFNGTGTVSIRSQFNISALIDNGIGDYTIVFNTPMINTNYSFVTWCRDYNTDNTIFNNLAARSTTTKTTTSLRLIFNNTNNALNYDSSECNIIVFGP